MNRISSQILLFVLIVFSTSAFSQKGIVDGSKYGHGEDSIDCLQNLSTYRTNLRNKKYDTALIYWRKAFNECPQSTKNIFIDGTALYKLLLDNPEYINRKNDLSDTLMMIYEKRIQYFGEKGQVRGRQGVDLLKYKRNDGPEYIWQGYQFLNESIELTREEVSKATLVTYMTTALVLYKKQEISDIQVIDDYMLVMQLIDKISDLKPNDTSLNMIKQAINKNFKIEGPSDCQVFIDYFIQKQKENTGGNDYFKRLISLIDLQKCTSEDVFILTLKNIFEATPTGETAYTLATLSMLQGENEEAIIYFRRASELEATIQEKYECYYDMALCYQKLGDKVKSREAAQRAIQINPSDGNAYLLIGQLYADSKYDCKNHNLPNSVYWLATDLFIKAIQVDPSVEERANQLISECSAFFPTAAEAETKSIHTGDIIKIRCWIKESTKARFNE